MILEIAINGVAGNLTIFMGVLQLL